MLPARNVHWPPVLAFSIGVVAPAIIWPSAFRSLLDSDGFMPHGHCYLWRSDLVLLHVISDSLIALAYASIPITLVYFVRKRQDLPFNWVFLAFGVFIISCGMTHVME